MKRLIILVFKTDTSSILTLLFCMKKKEKPPMDGFHLSYFPTIYPKNNGPARV